MYVCMMTGLRNSMYVFEVYVCVCVCVCEPRTFFFFFFFFLSLLDEEGSVLCVVLDEVVLLFPCVPPPTQHVCGVDKGVECYVKTCYGEVLSVVCAET